MRVFNMENSDRGVEGVEVCPDGDIVVHLVDEGPFTLHTHDLIPVVDAWLDAVSSKTDGFGPCSKQDCDAPECALERLVERRSSSERSGTVSSNETETDVEHLNNDIRDLILEKVRKRAAAAAAIKSALDILESTDLYITPEDLIMADNPVDALAEAFDSARLKLADAVLEVVAHSEGDEPKQPRLPKIGDRVRLNKAGEDACGGDQKAGFETRIEAQNGCWWELSGISGYFAENEFDIIEDEA